MNPNTLTRQAAGSSTSTTWAASYITGGQSPRGEGEPALMFRRQFEPSGNIASARLLLTARGVVEAFINGTKVGDDLLAPGWTSYHHRLLWRSHDVTELLSEGTNVLGALVVDGWYAGRLGFGGGERNRYGDHIALLAQLEITYHDGTTEQLGTDQTWEWTEGAIRSSSLYDGETVDFRRTRQWHGSWPEAQPARLAVPAGEGLGVLEEQIAPPVRVTDTLHHTSRVLLSNGRFLLDFGQNITGRVRIRLNGDASLTGHRIRLRHAEVLENGELAVRPLRLAAQTDEIVLDGNAVDWAPMGTVHGFRYVEIDGWPTPENDLGQSVVAEVMHTDFLRTGWFGTDHPGVNRLHENIVWSMRGNSVALPTDCPQRDERLGWTGDVQLFAPTAVFLYDCYQFLGSWLRDLAAEQHDDGYVPLWIPTLPAKEWPPFFASVWGDAAVIVPWTLYEATGNAEVLEQQYQSMTQWMTATTGMLGGDGLWTQPFQFGDWLDPAAPPENPAASDTDAHLVANAYLIRCCRIMARTATVLGHLSNAARWKQLAEEVNTSWIRTYVQDDGTITGDTATTYALALVFDLLPTEALRQRAGHRLAAIVRAANHTITTGFVGTPIICDALTLSGNHEDAGKLLLQESCPSWLYPVTMGATTVWERWDSMLPDGTVNPGDMTSFNHYALGAVGSWLHRVIGGLDYVAAPEPRLIVNPRPVQGITTARTSRNTPHGTVTVQWRLIGNLLEITTDLPEGLVAQDGRGVPLPAGRSTFTTPWPGTGQQPG